ncbi:hypothetical protein LLH23_24035 [bacterium]|nr:hypothetical protein [bacterium]
MKTLRTMLVLTALCLAVVVSAAPAGKPRQGARNTPPTATMAQSHSQPANQAAANRGWGKTTPTPQRPQGNGPAASGNAPGTPATGPFGQGGNAPGYGQPKPNAPSGHGPGQTPAGNAPGYSQPKPSTPSGHGPGQTPAGNAPGYSQPKPNAPSGHGPGQTPARDERSRSYDHRGFAPPQPQCPAPRHDGHDRPSGRHNDGHWRYLPLVALILRAFTPSDPDVLGAVIIGADDTFLGVISRDTDDPESITNREGRWGSRWSDECIWNPEGSWGSRYAPDSPWNPYATRPPRVFDDHYFIGYLTTNTDLHPRIDPEWLRTYLRVPRW